MRHHLLVVSEKKIKMLKTPFVISQGKVSYRKIPITGRTSIRSRTPTLDILKEHTP